MPPNTTVFLLGLAVGTGLLLLGLLLGYWLGRKSSPPVDIDQTKFFSFLGNLSNLTSEFSGDVSKYQTRLNDISKRIEGGDSGGTKELSALLSQIMEHNNQLKQRLDSTEAKLETQTDQIANYLTEARTDGLTGLLNRRAFDKTTDELYSAWKQQGQAFALGLIDIDHFKQINDTHGHPAGDAVLIQISRILQEELGDVFTVARYGGEEFAILAPVSAMEAGVALDRVRETISKSEIEHEGLVIPVTMSGGSSEIADDDRVGNLVRRADEGLYTSKMGGRNRVNLHDGKICHLITKIDPVAEQAAAEEAKRQSREHLNKNESEEVDTKADVIQQRLQRLVQEESERILNK